MQIKAGDTDRSATIRIVDSTTGLPEEGVTSATPGLALWYRRAGGAKTAVSISDLSALTDAHADGGLLHVDDGYYRLDLPDAAVASGADEVLIGGVATGMVVLGEKIQLTSSLAQLFSTRTLTQAAANVIAAVSGSSITVYRGTTWSISLTGLGDISAYDTIYFSVKEKLSDADSSAYLRVRNAASGLERFNKAAPTAAANGTIAIDDAGAGNITITVQEEETVNAPLLDAFYYDVKGVDDDGNVDLLSVGSGQFTVAGDVTRAITS